MSSEYGLGDLICKNVDELTGGLGVAGTVIRAGLKFIKATSSEINFAHNAITEALLGDDRRRHGPHAPA